MGRIEETEEERPRSKGDDAAGALIDKSRIQAELRSGEAY